MSEKVFRVDKDGNLIGLYTDSVPLRGLGKLDVERASNVEFDNTQQGWTITLADGTTLPGVFPTREAALSCEVSHVQDRLRAGVVQISSYPTSACRNGHALCLRASCWV